MYTVSMNIYHSISTIDIYRLAKRQSYLIGSPATEKLIKWKKKNDFLTMVNRHNDHNSGLSMLQLFAVDV